jgi:DNA-binding Lrp family transcriptional regulator
VSIYALLHTAGACRRIVAPITVVAALALGGTAGTYVVRPGDTLSAIAGRFGVSVRTVYRDIRTLEAAGIPIGSDAGLGYYLVEGYRLPPFKFSLKEVAALITAGKLIDRFKEPSLKEDFDSAMYKIKAVLNTRDRDYAEELQNLISIEKHQNLISIEEPCKSTTDNRH